MAGTTNAELAADCIASIEAGGQEIYRQWDIGEDQRQERCYLGPIGDPNTISGHQLLSRVKQWLKANEIPKSDPQAINITNQVIDQTEVRGPLPPALIVFQRLGINAKAKKKKK